MGRLLTVKDTLEDTYEFEQGDHLEIKVVWHSEQDNRYCFIFTDRDDIHIGGVLRKYDHNTSNFYQKLKSKPNYFQITPTNIEENDHIQSRLVRSNPKQLLLSNSTISSQLKVLEKTPEEFPKHLPFDFTTLDDVDECNVGDVIDIIGNITSISDVNESKNGKALYQHVQVRSSRSKTDGYQREVALFGPFLERVKGKNSVFAFMNLKVKEFEKALGTNKTLQIFGSTIILKIERDDLSILPPKYREEQFVLDLFPKKRATTKKSLQSSTVSTQQQEPKQENTVMATPNQNLFQFKASLSTFTTSSSSSSTFSGVFSGSSIFGGTMNAGTPKENAVASASCVVKRSASTCENSLEPTKRQCIASKPVADVAICNEENKDTLAIPVKKYNFTRNTDLKRLEVVMKKSSTLFATDSNCYQMDNGGAALIIHNYYFPHKKGSQDNKNRHGSLRDVEIFTTLFKKLGIDVETRHDVKATELPKILDDFKKRFREDTDVCFVVVLSHGSNDVVEMHDGYCIPLPNDIIHQFDDIAFPQMKEKPKIFFVQACQRIVDKTKLYHSMPDRSQDVELNDAIVIKAAIAGTSAVRDYRLGSPFAYVFADTCMEYASDHDLVTIISSRNDYPMLNMKAETNYNVKKLYTTLKRNCSSTRKGLNPEPESHFIN